MSLLGTHYSLYDWATLGLIRFITGLWHRRILHELDAQRRRELKIMATLAQLQTAVSNLNVQVMANTAAIQAAIDKLANPGGVSQADIDALQAMVDANTLKLAQDDAALTSATGA